MDVWLRHVILTIVCLAYLLVAWVTVRRLGGECPSLKCKVELLLGASLVGVVFLAFVLSL